MEVAAASKQGRARHDVGLLTYFPLFFPYFFYLSFPFDYWGEIGVHIFEAWPSTFCESSD